MLSVCVMSGFNKQPTAAFARTGCVEVWHYGSWLPAVVLGRRLEDAHGWLTLVRITMPDQAEVTWVRQADLRMPPCEATTGVAGDTWSRIDGGAQPGRHRAWEDSLTDGPPGEARTARLPMRPMPVPAARRDLSAPDAMGRAREPGGTLAANPATERFGRRDAPAPSFRLPSGPARGTGERS
jgi:hypothetical protein